MDTDKIQILDCPICGYYSGRIWSETIYHAFRCKKCGVIFCGHKASRFLYDEDYFCRWYIKPFQKRKRYLKKILRKIEKFVELPEGNYLDVGCGAGIFLDIAKENRWQATGMDISTAAVDYCRKKNLNVIPGDLAESGFQSEQFDVVSLFDVIAHLENPVNYLREIRRIIKSSGVLIIKTPRHPPRLFHIACFLRFTRKSRVILHIPAQIFHFNECSLRKICSLSGFDTVSVFRTNDLPCFFLKHGPVDMVLTFLYLFLKIFCGDDSVVAICRKKL